MSLFRSENIFIIDKILKKIKKEFHLYLYIYIFLFILITKILF